MNDPVSRVIRSSTLPLFGCECSSSVCRTNGITYKDDDDDDDDAANPITTNTEPTQVAGAAPSLAPTVTTPAPTSAPVCSSLTEMPTPQIKQLLKEEAGYDVDSSDDRTTKRQDYIGWDDYFMAIAALSAQRSKDPHNPTGACLVDEQNRVVGIGYNGFPRGCDDDVLPWTATTTQQDGEPVWLHTPDPFVCHAEVNAILNRCSNAPARLYVPNFPNNECAKIIIQSGVQEVIYSRDERHDDDAFRASRILLHMAGVTMRQYVPQLDSVTLELCGKGSAVVSEEPLTDQNTVNHSATTQSAVLSEHRELIKTEANYTNSVSTKRRDYLSWDDYFMAVAFLTAKRSKDPNTQVGACIVNAQKRIVGLGYNGFPKGASDDWLPWARKGSSDLHTKYPYVCHAEVNAILNKGAADVQNSTIYVALFPCNECAKVIIQAGIREVVYLHDTYHQTDMCKASRILFAMAGVKLRRLTPSVTTIKIGM